MMQLAREERPRSSPAGGAVLVARPQMLLLPHAVVVSVRFSGPPAAGGLLAYAMAFPVGARRSTPNFYEFEECLGLGKAAKGSAASGSDGGSGSQGSGGGTSAKPKPTRQGSSSKL